MSQEKTLSSLENEIQTMIDNERRTEFLFYYHKIFQSYIVLLELIKNLPKGLKCKQKNGIFDLGNNFFLKSNGFIWKDFVIICDKKSSIKITKNNKIVIKFDKQNMEGTTSFLKEFTNNFAKLAQKNYNDWKFKISEHKTELLRLVKNF